MSSISLLEMGPCSPFNIGDVVYLKSDSRKKPLHVVNWKYLDFCDKWCILVHEKAPPQWFGTAYSATLFSLADKI